MADSTRASDMNPTSALLTPIPRSDHTPNRSPLASPASSTRNSYFGTVRENEDNSEHDDTAANEPLLAGVDARRLENALNRRHESSSGTNEKWPTGFLAETKEWAGKNTGLLLIASAQFFFAGMNSSVKLLQDPKMGGGLPTLQLIFIRMIVTFAGCVSYLYYLGDPHPLLGPPEVRKLLVVRGVIGFFGLAGMYQSLQHLSLSEATTIAFLAPTGTGILGYLLLKEPFTRREATAGFISLFGVILIARPTALFGSSTPSSTGLPVSPEWGGDSRTSWHDKVYDPDTGVLIQGDSQTQRLAAVGFGLLGVCGASGAYIAVRAIGHRAKPFHSVSYFSFYCIVVSVIGSIVFRIPVTIPKTLLGWGLIALIGVFGLSAQILLTMGLQREKAGRGSLAMYTQLLFATILEKVLFKAEPGFLSWFGTAIILGSALWIAFSKQEKSKDVESNLPPVPPSGSTYTDTQGNYRTDGAVTPTNLDGTHHVAMSRSGFAQANGSRGAGVGARGDTSYLNVPADGKIKE